MSKSVLALILIFFQFGVQVSSKRTKFDDSNSFSDTQSNRTEQSQVIDLINTCLEASRDKDESSSLQLIHPDDNEHTPRNITIVELPDDDIQTLAGIVVTKFIYEKANSSLAECSPDVRLAQGNVTVNEACYETRQEETKYYVSTSVKLICMGQIDSPMFSKYSVEVFGIVRVPSKPSDEILNLSQPLVESLVQIG